MKFHKSNTIVKKKVIFLSNHCHNNLPKFPFNSPNSTVFSLIQDIESFIGFLHHCLCDVDTFSWLSSSGRNKQTWGQGQWILVIKTLDKVINKQQHIDEGQREYVMQGDRLQNLYYIHI